MTPQYQPDPRPISLSRDITTGQFQLTHKFHRKGRQLLNWMYATSELFALWQTGKEISGDTNEFLVHNPVSPISTRFLSFGDILRGPVECPGIQWCGPYLLQEEGFFMDQLLFMSCLASEKKRNPASNGIRSWPSHSKLSAPCTALSVLTGLLLQAQYVRAALYCISLITTYVFSSNEEELAYRHRRQLELQDYIKKLLNRSVGEPLVEPEGDLNDTQISVISHLSTRHLVRVVLVRIVLVRVVYLSRWLIVCIRVISQMDYSLQLML